MHTSKWFHTEQVVFKYLGIHIHIFMYICNTYVYICNINWRTRSHEFESEKGFMGSIGGSKWTGRDGAIIL